MAYEINDKNLIQELTADNSGAEHPEAEICKTVEEEKARLLACVETHNQNHPDESICLREDFDHPLDAEVRQKLKALLPEGMQTIQYAKADELDNLWRMLLEKAICCLRLFDTREPFLSDSEKTIVAYGIDNLEEYHRKYTKFEGLMYGASAYYRDHVFHAIRVWMLGIFCLVGKINGQDPFYSKITLDGGATPPSEINFFEYISMWTIAALCHDLGYPLEKAEQILSQTKKMMKEFIPNPNVWNNFGYSGTQDSINEYILKFISTKMKADPDETTKADSEKKTAETAKVGSEEKAAETAEEAPESEGPKYLGRIQPKYYLKYAKSLESFQHGIISTIIVYKMLLYFLESDFNLNDDYQYKAEDARQFYIRREILRAMASHTCPDAYNIHINTFSSLLFLCDELQEWGRKTWSELYTGLSENSIALTIANFSCEQVDVEEEVNMTEIKDQEVVIDNICRIFKRQYSLYKTTFRDGQHTSKRDFGLTKKMTLKLPKSGARVHTIVIRYSLPKTGQSTFTVDLSNAGSVKTQAKENIPKRLRDEMYAKDLTIT